MIVFRFLSAPVRLLFYTLAYCLHPLTPDYVYLMKARAWCDLNLYTFAIRCYTKALRDVEMIYVRGEMAWCYYRLDMYEQAGVHYRAIYQQTRHADMGVYLADTEFQLGNLDEARSLLARVQLAPHRIRPDYASFLEQLERDLAEVESSFLPDRVASPPMQPQQNLHQPVRD